MSNDIAAADSVNESERSSRIADAKFPPCAMREKYGIILSTVDRRVRELANRSLDYPRKTGDSVSSKLRMDLRRVKA